MIDLTAILGVARAEARLARRLVRYWVFLSLAALAGFAFYMYYWAIHRQFSSWSATAAITNPRFLAGSTYGFFYLLIFAVGLVFLAFDLRSRDRRERVAEVLDTRPIDNLELVLGKFTGLLLAGWIPLLVLGITLELLAWAFFVPIEPRSFFGLMVLLALPFFVVVLGLVFFVSLLVPHRLGAAVLSLGILGAGAYALFQVKVYWFPMLDLVGSFVLGFPSDLIGSAIEGRGLLQRLAVLLVGAGLLVLAAAVHPRRDDASRPARWGLGAGLALAGLAIAFTLARANLAEVNQVQAWKAAHQALSSAAVPDLVKLGGLARVRPGRDLALDLDLVFRAPEGRPLEIARFTLNPGLEIEKITLAGAPAAHQFASGLLSVPLSPPLAPGEERTLKLVAQGSLDGNFGYLDASLVLANLKLTEGNAFLLGDHNLIDDGRLVAFLPGVHWLPTSGTGVGIGDGRKRPADFFLADLTVDLPLGWIPAAPGRRQEAGGGEEGRVRYRFHPEAPLDGVGLVAGKFVRRTAAIEGVHCEILLHPKHQAALKALEDAEAEITRWAGEKIKEAASGGLSYPYGGLTFVEVPNPLRAFGGGWRTNSTFAPPGMVLLREMGFPTARFDIARRSLAEPADQLPEKLRDRLLTFFENDFSGGNPFTGAARSFLLAQTQAQGPDAPALDAALETLASELITGRKGYFSAHLFTRQGNQAVGQALQTWFATQGDGASVADAVLESTTSRGTVWEAVLDTSLTGLNPEDNPARAVDALALKAGGMARALHDTLGRTRSYQLLASLRAARGGMPFTRADLIAAGRAGGEDMTPFFKDWLDEKDLPAFVAGDVQAFRLKDSAAGEARYQVLVTVRNEGRSPGLVRLRYRQAGEQLPKSAEQDEGPRPARGEEGSPQLTDPYRIPRGEGLEIGLVTARPVRSLKVVPYLSLNRRMFEAVLPVIDDKKMVEAEAFAGARPAPPARATGIVLVDDLDPGFRVQDAGGGGGLRLAGKGEETGTDQGLPQFILGGPPSRWSRMTLDAATGRFRHTLVLVRAGEGKRKATFEAAIPKAGRYRLEVHLPPKAGARFPLQSGRGKWTFTLSGAAAGQEVVWDADAAEAGWNNLGVFPVGAGQATVELSDRSEGELIIADALRWVPEGTL